MCHSYIIIICTYIVKGHSVTTHIILTFHINDEYIIIDTVPIIGLKCKWPLHRTMPQTAGFGQFSLVRVPIIAIYGVKTIIYALFMILLMINSSKSCHIARDETIRVNAILCIVFECITIYCHIVIFDWILVKTFHVGIWVLAVKYRI